MENKYLQENKWWVSPYNFAEEVTAEFDIPDKVEIHDATLRDGEQTPGVVFRKEDKVRIAQMLDEVGVERIEAGMPAVSDEDFQAIKEISQLGLKARIFTFARALPVDIDKASDKKFYCVFMPSSPSPLTGFTIIVEEKDLTVLDIPMEDAIRIIVSGGLLSS